MTRIPASLAALLVLAASCATLPPQFSPGPIPPLPATAVPGSLVEAKVVFRRPASEYRNLLGYFSTFTLGFQIDTSMLASAGFDAWKDSRLPLVGGVEAVRVRFVGITPQGGPDLQSGMLFLPYENKRVDKLDWVVYDRASELLKADVPSNLTNTEADLGALLASLGHAVWMPDYGGSGDSPGQQHYCLPDSLAASSLDGLAAVRAWVSQNTDWKETGRLRVFGYSEGGLATMATLKSWADHPDATPGLQLTDAYPMGAPLNLQASYHELLDGTLVLTHPHYTILLVLGWARAFPDQVYPGDILRPDIVETIVPLLDGLHKNTEVHAAVAKLRNKAVGTITAADVFRADFLQLLKTDPTQSAYYNLQVAARLDTWVPPASVALTYAVTLKDKLVAPSNSQNSLAAVLAQHPDAQARLVQLATGTHTWAGFEALVWAIMDLDKKTNS